MPRPRRADDDIARAVPSALARHPAVRDVALIGSRAEGRAHDISDWDFAVESDGFESVARELPRLVACLDPIAEQWDPCSTHAGITVPRALEQEVLPAVRRRQP